MKEANFSNLQWQRLSREELKLTKNEEELNFTLAYELCIVGYMKDIGITNEPRLVHSYFHYYHILHSKLYICSALYMSYSNNLFHNPVGIETSQRILERGDTCLEATWRCKLLYIVMYILYLLYVYLHPHSPLPAAVLRGYLLCGGGPDDAGSELYLLPPSSHPERQPESWRVRALLRLQVGFNIQPIHKDNIKYMHLTHYLLLHTHACI